jgi:hypothetical protein
VVGEFVVLCRVVAPPPPRPHAAGTAARIVGLVTAP